MEKFIEVKKGDIALIQQQENGDICQIGLTKEQSKMLQIFLASLSKESKLILLPKQFNLYLKK